MEESKKKVMSTRELCYIAMFAAVTAVCAQIQIAQPGGVPFTLQAWAISLAGLVLGPKNGTIAALPGGFLWLCHRSIFNRGNCQNCGTAFVKQKH